MKKPTTETRAPQPGPLRSMTTGVVALLAMAVLTGCSTMQSRVANNRPLFDSLPFEHQQAVLRQQVVEGMHEGAVYLAWGSPSRTLAGEDQNRRWTRWVWTRRSRSGPYITSGGYYGGRGYYGGGYTGVGLGWGESFANTAWRGVEFENGRVTSWWVMR